MKVGLIIPFRDRCDLLKKCLDSVAKKTFRHNVELLLIDDASVYYGTIRTYEESYIPNCNKKIVRFEINQGIRKNLAYGFDYMFGMSVDFAISLDSDTIVTSDFIERIVELKLRFPDNIVIGINSTNYNKDGSLRNPIISEHEDYVMKKYCNGQCICVSKENYDKYLGRALSINGNFDYNVSLLLQQDNPPIIATKPSVVQHIGFVSAMGHDKYGEPDISLDFPKISLPQVTVFGIDANDPIGITRAMDISTRHIDFGAKILITDRLFQGREGYSRFCIKEMKKYINTDYVLIIHSDGYIQNPYAWSEEFLKYDYIGALWEWYDENRNGNGGFSLRSKKLLDAIAVLDIREYHPEDDVICRHWRPVLESRFGIKFAPDDVCRKFSIEAYKVPYPNNEYKGQFGFHGYSVTKLPIPPLERVNNSIRNKQKTIHRGVTRGIYRK